MTPMNCTAKGQQQTGSQSMVQIGSTWKGAGLNIDLDNIMGSKAKQSGPAPTMNQLATNSPQHQAKPAHGKSIGKFAIPEEGFILYKSLLVWSLNLDWGLLTLALGLLYQRKRKSITLQNLIVLWTLTLLIQE
jgi:hypothetical protein